MSLTFIPNIFQGSTTEPYQKNRFYRQELNNHNQSKMKL